VLVGLLRHGAEIVGVPSMQAGNCFIDALSFQLKHSGLQGMVSQKWSLLFPDDPERGKLLRPRVNSPIRIWWRINLIHIPQCG
jgi:hypothetical protein